MNALEIRSLNVYYGPIHALKDVDVDVAAGKVTTLLGANGAGKTTLLRTLSGLIKPRSGTINLGDRNITGLEPFGYTDDTMKKNSKEMLDTQTRNLGLRKLVRLSGKNYRICATRASA